MSYYFQKCCFDSEKNGVRNECDKLSCISNGKHNFGLFFHRNNDETFYCLKRKQLEEYWQCVIAEQQAFCPDKCGFCDILKKNDKSQKFKIEIAETVEASHLVLNYDKTY